MSSAKIQVLQSLQFKKAVKKLHAKQKQDLDNAIKILLQAPTIGEQKKGDLAFLRVYKFKMAQQLTLLAYSYQSEVLTLQLIALGSHENFYRDVKQMF